MRFLIESFPLLKCNIGKDVYGFHFLNAKRRKWLMLHEVMNVMGSILATVVRLLSCPGNLFFKDTLQSLSEAICLRQPYT